MNPQSAARLFINNCSLLKSAVHARTIAEFGLLTKSKKRGSNPANNGLDSVCPPKVFSWVVADLIDDECERWKSTFDFPFTRHYRYKKRRYTITVSPVWKYEDNRKLFTALKFSIRWRSGKNFGPVNPLAIVFDGENVNYNWRVRAQSESSTGFREFVSEVDEDNELYRS